jgi:hypothetical protein
MVAGNNTAEGLPPIRDVIPKLTHKVVYQTEFATYEDYDADNKRPVKITVNWDHPLIKGAAVGVKAVSRSTMSYGDHIWAYNLNKEDEWSSQKGLYNYWWNKNVPQADKDAQLDGIDAKVAEANYRNFVITLLGECRDYPFMVKRKLEILNFHTPANKSGEQKEVADAAYPFDSLSGDGYSRLRWIMSAVFSARQSKQNPNLSGFNYAWNQVGHVCNRIDNGVAPTTHAEMRYIFSEWLKGAPKQFNLEAYEAGLKKFIAEKCDTSAGGPDLGYSYDFRGHKNFKANWFECNAFIWLSRDAARIAEAQIKSSSLTYDPSYYQRPFATRYAKTKELMGTYLFYKNEDHQHMRKASESGGGPHLYIDNEDTNNDGLADYRLFANVLGQGDIGLESQALPKEQVGAQPVTREAVAGFSASSFKRYYDWGFNRILTVNSATRDRFKVDGVFNDSDSDAEATFKLRMARINVALDRHTNWGPTQMFSPKAFQIAKRYSLRGAYSPIVAMSYEISKSHSFATGNYEGSTHPKDMNKTKFMFIVKFQTQEGTSRDNYYDEKDLRAGRRIRWDSMYLNESSLSNDYYHERALDKFGWIPARDISSAAYMAEADGESSYYPPSGGGFGLTSGLDTGH